MSGPSELRRAAAAADEETVGPKVDNNRAFGPLSGQERRRLGRLAGILMIVGALVSLPARLVLEPTPEAYEHLIGLGSALSGVALLLAPWERISANWLHVGMIVATLEIASAVAVFSDDYAFFLVLVAMFVAYVIRDRTVLLAYALFLVLALLAPLAYADADLTEQAHHILVALPVLVIAAAIVRYLRDTLERRERQYRGFANEAVSLAERIRGANGGKHADEDLAVRLDRLSS